MKRNKEDQDMLPGTLEMLILQSLRGRPMHGYAISQYIRQTSDEMLQVEEGSLYPALQRLLRDEWVSAEWGLSSNNRKVRIYRLTAAGTKRLKKEAAGFERLLEGISRVMRPVQS